MLTSPSQALTLLSPCGQVPEIPWPCRPGLGHQSGPLSSVPTGGGAGLALRCQLPAPLAPEAVAVETQTDVLLNSNMTCGFSAECPSRAGQAGRVETEQPRQGAPPRPPGLPWPRHSEVIQRHWDCGRGRKDVFGKDVLRSSSLLPKSFCGRVWSPRAPSELPGEFSVGGGARSQPCRWHSVPLVGHHGAWLLLSAPPALPLSGHAT